MSNKNPFLNQTAYRVANSKRMPKSTPDKDISKAKLANQAIKILKQVRENYQRATSIDAVKQTRKNYHLGNIKKTAKFMNTLATLAPEKRKAIKKIVLEAKDIKSNSNDTTNNNKVDKNNTKDNNIKKSDKTTGQFKLSNGNGDNDNQPHGKIKIDMKKHDKK